ncbi:MAG: undecaprenyldiphospho-muramoylpentapeptide beta-N-acetylglucosaminyltransferase [Calditrichaeota bacterium]|nr:MAG: undecaprenyldiphospho-muramoylpentapeptide beta-N-acetylglucosaminyltransferase [Calditrichota bacterium]
MTESVRIIIAGGGTGGHLFPALNIAGALKEKYNAQITFIGTRYGIESRIVPAKGYHLVLIPVRGFQRTISLQNILFPFRLWKSVRMCRKTLRTFKPHLVIGTGGYVMGPVIKAARKLSIPYILQEQNSYPGVTTRWLAQGAEIIFTTYEEAEKYLKGAKKIIVSGNPVNVHQTVPDKKTEQKFSELKPDLKIILVFGGSQGSVNINRAVLNMVLENALPEGYQMLWQTGYRDFDEIKSRFKKAERTVPVSVTPFIEHMEQVYPKTEFAICRAGAMTISELIKFRLPAIFIPLKSAAANHQYKNALEIQKINGGVLLDDDENLSANLNREIKRWAGDQKLLKTMADNLKKMDRGNALEIIINEISKLLENDIDFPKLNKKAYDRTEFVG